MYKILFFLCLIFTQVFTQATYASLLDQKNSTYPYQGILLAQSDTDSESYDPFADYSEFDEASDEEADIYFFKHGRFFTLGIAFGYRFFTDNMSSLYSSSPSYGLFLTFFTDLRLAVQFGFSVGDHGFTFPTNQDSSVAGNVSFSFLHINLKYFANTQNLTRGLADLNPYFIGGAEQVYRTYTTNTAAGLASSRDSTLGLNFGGGLEIPFNRKKSFVGLQLNYHFVQFADENAVLTSPDSGAEITKRVSGDTYDVMTILGFNY